MRGNIGFIMMSENGFFCNIIWYSIWCGNMPELNVNQEYDWKLYYGAYVSTYIERDIKQFDLLDKIAQRGEGGVVCMTS